MGRSGLLRASLVLIAAIWCACSAAHGLGKQAGEERMIAGGSPGHAGGRLVIALRSGPRTLNPALALDEPSRDVIRCMTADLIHINRGSLKTEPSLAKSWSVSRDGRQYTLQLRRGVRFSDGEPFNADDVIFSFQVYLDEKVASSQRDLLLVGGKPITFVKVGDYAVRFELAQPYAAAERLFDSIAILPRHLLQGGYRAGGLSHAWSPAMGPREFVGLVSF